jgi:hypothetical protein
VRELSDREAIKFGGIENVQPEDLCRSKERRISPLPRSKKISISLI